MRAIVVLTRALVGAVSLAVVVLGPPVALWMFRSSFLPSHVPSAAEVLGWFTNRDTGEVFLGVLLVAGGVAWLQLVAALILESAAVLRGRTAPRLPGFGWAQKIVAALLLSLLAGAGVANASEQTPAIPVVQEQPIAPASAPSAASTQPRYSVVAGDSLMRIAQHQLGDERRYGEIFELNRGRRQADGDTLRDPGLLKPGWELLLPQDTNGECDKVVVQNGDTLSGIASKILGDSRRYLEIFALNEGRTQPSGRTLRDPNEIFPGDVLLVPRNGSPAGGGAAGGSAGPAALGPICSPTAEPTPQPSKVREPDAPAPSIPAAPLPSAPPPTAVASEAQDTSSMSTVVMSVGGILAAGILSTLGARRMLAQRRRRPGHRIVHPRTPGDFETELRMAEEPGTVQLLDRSLRALAHTCRQQGVDLPAVRSATVGRAGVALYPVDMDEPIDPFVKVSEDAWRLTAKLPSLEQLQDVPAPYPALVTLGQRSDRHLVLVNLEQVGAVMLRGGAEDVQEVLLAMAWDLAAAAWADHLVVHLVGFGQTTAAHNPDRLRYTACIDDVLDAFERRAHDVAHDLGGAGVASIGAARGRDVAEDAWTPEIILSAQTLTEAQQRRMLDLVALEGPANSLAAVITAADGYELPGAWTIDVRAGATHIEPLGVDVDVQRLTSTQVSELVAAFAAAEVVEQVPAEDYRHVPPEPAELPEPLPECTPVQPAHAVTIERTGHTGPELRLLGPVTLHNVDDERVERNKINRLTELAAYLALHPGATTEEISKQLGTTTQPWSAATRQGYISRLRSWLGRDSDGELYLPTLVTGRSGYRLAESFEVDWRRFQRLAQRGLNEEPATGLSHLKAALDLVNGTPFSNVAHSRYAWSSWIQRDMIDAIVDVAHTVAVICQKAGDIPSARRAVVRGLRAEPVSEILYRDLLRAEYRAGNLAGVKETADKLADLAADLDIELDDETNELVHKLLDPRYRATTTTSGR